jgi:hypothetical protein
LYKSSLMTYNHDVFIEKLNQLSSKKEQTKAMKDYMLSLPTAEFDAFLFGNIDKLGVGLEHLLTTNALSETDKNSIANKLDTLVEVAKSMKNNLSMDKVQTV